MSEAFSGYPLNASFTLEEGRRKYHLFLLFFEICSDCDMIDYQTHVKEVL